MSAAGLVALFDAVLSARVRTGSDAAVRLAVLYPYIGVTGAYVLARALGLCALVFAAASVMIGLERGRRRAEDLPASPLLGPLHRQVGLVTIALVAAHGLVPFAGADAPYGGLATVLVPFDQPISWGRHAAAFESLGILALYLLILVGPSYYLLASHRRWWSVVHTLSVVAYTLAVVHTLFLGSDFLVRGPARVVLIAVQVPVTLLLARRLRAAGGATRTPAVTQVAAALAVAASAGLAVIAAFGLAGAPLGGFPL